MVTSLGKKIRIKMIEMDVKGAKIAHKVGVNRSAIAKTINGDIKSFRLRKAIADALHLKVSDLWPPESDPL
jgi:hypothetical protein